MLATELENPDIRGLIYYITDQIFFMTTGIFFPSVN